MAKLNIDVVTVSDAVMKLFEYFGLTLERVEGKDGRPPEHRVVQDTGGDAFREYIYEAYGRECKRRGLDHLPG